MAGNTTGAVVVTGASTGIGRATALGLDRAGYRVFAGVRRQEDAKALKRDGSDRLTAIRIDVAKERSISAARRNVAKAVGEQGLVGLVNNAGVGGGGPIEFMDLAHFRDTIEVNLVGQLAVTQAFLPLIRTGHGTIVFIASIGGRVAAPFMSPYNTSKFGVEALGEGLRHELAPWDIDVVVVEPGSIDTPIWSKASDTVEERLADLSDEARRLYGRQMVRFAEMAQESAERGIPPEKVAEVIERAIRSDRPRHRYLVGTDAKLTARLKATLPDRTFHRMAAHQMKMPVPNDVAGE